MTNISNTSRQARQGRWGRLMCVAPLVAMLALIQLAVPRVHAFVGNSGGNGGGLLYAVCPINNFATARASGSVIPVMFYLGVMRQQQDGTSTADCSVDMGNAGGTLTLMNVDNVYYPGGQPSLSPSLGGATPGYTFVYSPTLHGQGGYMYNLNTDGIPSNTSHFMDIFVPNDTGAGDYLVTFNIPASP